MTGPLTALVVDPDAVARRQVAGLLQLGGWQVCEASTADQALAASATVSPDLVVTDVLLPDGSGPQLLGRLRRAGSTARFLAVTAGPTAAVRAECRTAGALACLAKPIDARLLLDLVERRSAGPVAEPGTAASAGADDLRDDDLRDDDVDDQLMGRLQGMYDDALPGRLTAIASSVRQGNTAAVAAAAQTLAGTSGQLGHPEVAGICQAIAADARRGILAHHLVADLATVALSVETAAGRITAEQQRSRLRLVAGARG
ncbi:response regulator transcription factor [Modestobacter lapidis]|nr:response regulator [Modestobacter lapidis]